MAEEEQDCCQPICFDTIGMVEQAKKNPHSLIDKEVCGSHVISVWDAISKYIMEQICAGRPVKIQGMITFTLKVMKIEISQTQVIVKRIPHAVVSGDLVRKCSLKVKRPAYNLDIPETMLLVSTIANIVGLSREHVQICIEEVLQAFIRALIICPQVQFIFPNIGRLVSNCREVEFVFCSDFLKLMGLNEEFVLQKWCPVR